MKHILMTIFGAAIIALASCNQAKPSEELKPAAEVQEIPAAPDMVKVKADIQAIESAWAAADNERNGAAIAAFYSDDAVSMSPNKPSLVGKAAIVKDIEESMAKRTKGTTIAFETVEVFGNQNIVTEIGKTIVKDASGKVISTDKYMAIWEKRDGKYICIRDMYNEDQKEK